MAEFAGRVLFMARGRSKGRQLVRGTWLGLVVRTEALLGTPAGVVRAWVVKRASEHDR